MRKERERRTLETAGMLFTLLFGNLLHFVYDWTGQAGWAAYLSAVNESTWEHMKLLFFPVLLLSVLVKNGRQKVPVILFRLVPAVILLSLLPIMA